MKKKMSIFLVCVFLNNAQIILSMDDNPATEKKLVIYRKIDNTSRTILSPITNANPHTIELPNDTLFYKGHITEDKTIYRILADGSTYPYNVPNSIVADIQHNV